MPETSKVIHDDTIIFPAPEHPKHKPHVDKEAYTRMYKQSIDDPEAFWGKQAERLSWIKPWDRVKNTSFDDDISIRWFEGGKLNVCYNCVDRHLPAYGDKTAIIWEGDDPVDAEHITYKMLHHNVCKFANILKDHGVNKGDVVTIYMPMIPEAAYAMLACARIGAVHSVVFGGFSPEALRGRIENCHSRFIITADEGKRGGKTIPLKANVDKALKLLENPLPSGEARNPSHKECHPALVAGSGEGKEIKVLVIENTGGKIHWEEGRDISYREAFAQAHETCEPEVMDAEDPLFILYTSGSTGKPKGVLHTGGGYLLYAALTHEVVFDYQEGDIYWCTADVGWVTGHSYILYGPLANAATTLMFEGVPNYPDNSRFWQIVDKHNVNSFYTAPTAIRALMAHGDKPVKQATRESLRILGTVGEPINPEAWMWYHSVVGEGRCPIVDTWWQTETGGHMITPLPYAHDLKPGSASFPFFGVQLAIMDAEGNILEGEAEGSLCILDSWPGQMRTVYGDHERFKATYFSQFPGKYFSGDGCKRDKDGYYWITGRVDDVLNVSGHRMGTAEVESALVAHDKVAEAAVVGFPHDIKGQGIYAFVTVNSDVTPDDTLKKALIEQVRSEIGPIAKPDFIQWAPGLPKTRSGKIMRRILRKIAENSFDNLGETSTLLNPEVVEKLIEERLNKAE